MKKAISLLIYFLFFIGAVQASTGGYRQAAGGDAQFSQYQQKRSAWCNVMRASKCADPAGFDKYLKHGCINDLDSESKCLRTFCMQNCASVQCPSMGSPLAGMCNEHCQKVDLRDKAAQTLLKKCVVGSYDPTQAASKSASRDYYRAQQKNLSGAERAALKRAQKVLNLVKDLSEKRKALFYVDGASLSKAGIVRIDDFLKNVDEAIILTDKMNKAVEALAVSGQAPDIVAQARALMARSDQEVAYFVKVVAALGRKSQQLMQVVKAGEGAGVQPQSAAPVPSPRASQRLSNASTDSWTSEVGGDQEPA